MSAEEIAEACPVCRIKCNCKPCLRMEVSNHVCFFGLLCVFLLLYIFSCSFSYASNALSTCRLERRLERSQCS